MQGTYSVRVNVNGSIVFQQDGLTLKEAVRLEEEMNDDMLGYIAILPGDWQELEPGPEREEVWATEDGQWAYSEVVHYSNLWRKRYETSSPA